MRWPPRLEEKPLHWVGSAKSDLLRFPVAVRRRMGYALGAIQLGRMPVGAKAWHGEGPGTWELVDDGRDGTYRVVLAVRFERAIYVLHCFQKKSPSGRRTARTDVELVRRRLRAAKDDYEARYGKA